MSFFAHFRMHEGHQFRLDTRIYLRDSDKPGERDTCVAAIIGKNPGSANPTQFNRLTQLSLDGDKLLPNVRNRFRAAYERSGSQIPRGAYIRVWNLLYLCNPDLKDAIASFTTVRRPLICDTEQTMPRMVWFAWGPPNPKLSEYMSRFLDRAIDCPFYYDIDAKKVVTSKPTLTSKVKHTQGLPMEPVERHLSRIVGR